MVGMSRQQEPQADGHIPSQTTLSKEITCLVNLQNFANFAGQSCSQERAMLSFIPACLCSAPFPSLLCPGSLA